MPVMPIGSNAPNLPLFTDTGLKVGDELADVVGCEWDCRDPRSKMDAALWREGAAIAELPQARVFPKLT